MVPGEDSRNKQLREIQRLLATAPILVEVPMHPHTAATMAPGDLLMPHATSRPSHATSPASVAPPFRAASGSPVANTSTSSEPGAASSSDASISAHASTPGALKGAATTSNSGPVDHGSRNVDHALHTLVLPSVPVDQLLDDHAVEFEECKRWANSEAGQSAHLTNPAGFANVRAHAEAHLRAMSIAAAPPALAPRNVPAG